MREDFVELGESGSHKTELRIILRKWAICVRIGVMSLQLPVGVTDNETYIRDTITVGDVSITFYGHESLTAEQVLDQIVTHYKAWAVNQPGSRL